MRIVPIEETVTDADAPQSRGAMRPRFCKSIRPKKRRRDTRILLRPRSRVKECKKRHAAYRYSWSLRHYPAQWFTAYGALSLETNSSCLHRRREASWHRSPVRPRQTSAGLTPATGARTSTFCRTHQRQSSARCVRSRTEKARPANTTTRPTLPRPPQPAPTFVTMANAPLPGRDGANCKGDLGSRERNIFADEAGPGKSR